MCACRVLPVACGQAGQPGAVWSFWPVGQAARRRVPREAASRANAVAPLAFLICNLISAIAHRSVRRHTRCGQHGCSRSRWTGSHVAHFEGARRAARRIQNRTSLRSDSAAAVRRRWTDGARHQQRVRLVKNNLRGRIGLQWCRTRTLATLVRSRLIRGDSRER